MSDSACIRIAGLDFCFSSPANVVFADLSHPRFLPFRRPEGAGSGGDRLDIHVHPLEDGDVPAGFQHVVTTDLQSQIYRDGRTFLIHKFDVHPPRKSLAWATRYDSENETVDTGVLPLRGSGPAVVLPELGLYPHYQFLLTGYLARRHGALHHCAGAIHHGKMFLFPARSGTGKSTLSRLLAAAGSFDVVGDDTIVTRRLGRDWMAFGTPWPSSAGFSGNRSAPLGGVFFLHQSPCNRVEDVPAQEALRGFLPETDIPWYDPVFTEGILAHCEDLVESVPMRALHFRPDASAVDCLLEALER